MLQGFDRTDKGLQCTCCHTVYEFEEEDDEEDNWESGAALHEIIFVDLDGKEIGACEPGYECDCGKLIHDGGRCLSKTGCLYCGGNAVGRLFVMRDEPANEAVWCCTGEKSWNTFSVLEATTLSNGTLVYLTDASKDKWCRGWVHSNYRPATKKETETFLGKKELEPKDNLFAGIDRSSGITMVETARLTEDMRETAKTCGKPITTAEDMYFVDGKVVTRTEYIKHELKKRGSQVRIEADCAEDWW